MTNKSLVKPVALGCMLSALITLVPGITAEYFSNIGINVSSFAQLQAQAPACKEESKPRRLPAANQKLVKQMEEVSELASPPEDSGIKPNFPEALKKIKAIEKRCTDCNPYELAQIYNYVAWINYSLENVDEAIKYYQKVIDQSPNIVLAVERQTIYTLGQLLFSQEKYKESLAQFKRWEATCPTNIGAEHYMLLGQLYYQLDDKKSALANASRAVRMKEEKGQVPQQQWYKFEMALYVEKEDFKTALTVMEKLVPHYPEINNLTQLASLYAMVGREKDQWSILDAVNVLGGLKKESEVMNLAYLSMSEEIPYKAAKVIEQGLKNKVVERTSKNLNTYGAALQQAQEIEEAIPIIEEAAKKSDSGEIYARLAAIYLSGDQNEEVIPAAKKALEKGNLKRKGDVYLQMGSAQLNLKRYDDALKSFREAAKDKDTKVYAEPLIKYAIAERERERKLKEASSSSSS